MTKKTPSKSIEGLTIINTGFSFTNPSCELRLNDEYDSNGDPHKNLRVKNSLGNLIKYKYTSSLYKDSDFAEEKDIVSSLISIEDGNEEQLMQFFNENGFLFRTSSEKFCLYSCEDLFSVIKRIRFLVEIITELHNESPSYVKIIENLLYLMLMEPISISDISHTDKESNTIIYQSAQQNIQNDLKSIGVLDSFPDSFREFEDDNFTPDSNVMYFEQQYYSFSENHRYFMSISDDIEKQHNFLEYVLSLTSIRYVEKGKGVILSQPIKSKPNIKQIEIINTAAKLIIKEEIEHHTRNILPKYDITTMLGSWEIPDFISAIYFAIFFLNPQFRIVKKCANVTCSTYFPVLYTNKKKIYCSTRCANAVNQRKLRSRK